MVKEFDSKGFYIRLLSEGTRDFESLEVDRALEKLQKETVKVIDFIHEFDLEEILSQRPNKVVNTLTNELLWILNFFKQKGVYTSRTLKK